jgi:AraC family transcriptional regulator, ethanolamine operon transcriptional activator
MLQDSLCEPITIAGLSQAVGVSERTLRYAFASVYRESPKQHFLRERLAAVRRALDAPATATATVTSIATDHGFFELGRFAAQYKAAFAEYPSETLRRTLRRQARQGLLARTG